MNRLLQIKWGNIEIKYAINSSDLFILPSIVTAYNSNGLFEYCLLDSKEEKIYYIHLFSIQSVDNIVFNKKFTPTKQLNNSDFPKELIDDGGYSIYYSKL